MKKISLIIATYNAAKTLRRCLDSIVIQKDDSVELVIIDGGSKDNTVDIIKEYERNVDYWISEKDKGIYDAWNKGVRAATGVWIVFLGADDQLLPDFFSTYLKLLETVNSNEIDLISAKSVLVDENGTRLRSFGGPYKYERFKFFMDISHGSTLQNRKLFDEIGSFDTSIKICADYDFLLRKQMRALFVDKEVIVMQYGGMSNTVAGLIDGYRVRKKNHSISSVLNCIILIKGLIMFYIRKLL